MINLNFTLEEKEAYWDLFINRTDVYKRQDHRGKPFDVHGTLTKDVLFNPDENIGSYQLDKNNNVKFAVLDIDLNKEVWGNPEFNIDEWLPKLLRQTNIAKGLLSSRGIDSLTEFSGFKGYHIWIFFTQPVNAGIAKRFMHDIFDNMQKVDNGIHWEIFPKQDRISEKGYGSYVKPPLQIHKKSGKLCHFVDEQGKQIDVDLTKVSKYDASKIKVPVNNNKPVTNDKPDYSTPPPDMDNMFEKCALLRQIVQEASNDQLSHTEGHDKRLFLASVLKPFGEAGYNKLTDILKNISDYDETITRKHWDSLDKRPATCEKYCHDFPCGEISIAHGKSPIKFAYQKNNGDDITSLFVERNSCYYKKEKTRNGTHEKQISTFAIDPVELLVLPDRDCLLCDVKSSMGYDYNNVLLENVDWHTRQKFLKAIGHQDCTFTGSENDLQMLCSYINSKTPVRKTGTRCIGMIDDTWVINNYNITKSGQSKEMKIVPYDKGSDAFYHKIQYLNLSDDEHIELIKGFYQDIGKMNDHNVILPMIGWLFASPLKSVLMKKLDGFPVLFVHGGQGSGKSTTGRIMMRICGYAEAMPNSCTMRPFPMLKLLTSNNGIPIVLDEFKINDMENAQVNSILRYMRKSYAGEVEQKGHQDLTVEEYALTAPMVIMGEWNISQPALKERFILLRFSDSVKKNNDMQKSYQRIKDLPLEGFMPMYIEFCLNQDIDELVDTARKIVIDHFNNIDVAPRIINNLTTMLVGLLLFQRYAEHNGINVEKPDYASMLDSQLENITGSKTGYVKSAVDQLIEELGIMAINGEISNDNDYRIIDNKYLAIAFNKIFPKFKEYARKTNYEGEILDKESFKALFKECGYIPMTSEVKKLGEKPVRCIIVDIYKAKAAGISLDGF